MSSRAPTMLVLHVTAGPEPGTLEGIVVHDGEGPPRRKVRGTHWKSTARTDLLAAALALLSTRTLSSGEEAAISARSEGSERDLCVRLHDLWHSPRKRIESHWLDAVFEDQGRDLPSPLALILTRSGSRETATFRFASGFGAERVRFLKGGAKCSAAEVWAAYAARADGNQATTVGMIALPIYRTRLFGREEDRLALEALLLRERMISLIGPSGVGKTRMALEVARQFVPQCDGAVLLDLTRRQTAGQMARRLLAQIPAAGGPAKAPGAERPWTARLAERLADRTFLLILDNCETDLAAAAELVEAVLAATSRVAVLATSLDPLGVHGEVCYRLEPLELPAEDTSPTCSSGMAAIRLFVDRARAARAEAPSDGALAAEDLPHVVQICRSVGGLPLGIELAAGATRQFPIAELARLLDGHLELLRSTDRSAPPRHTSLRAVFEWTESLLSSAERRLLGLLSLFPESWSLDLLSALVVGIEGGDSESVLTRHARLVDLSLVRPAVPGRFALLPPLRAFAAARLAAWPDAERMRSAFEDLFVTLARNAAAADGSSSSTSNPFTVVAGEASNLQEAGLLAARSGDGKRAARVIEALFAYWLESGNWADGSEVCHAALTQCTLDPRSESTVLRVAAALEYRLGELPLVRQHYARVETIARDAGDQAALAHALHGMGAVAFRTGQLEEAEGRFGASSALWSALGDAKNLLVVTNNLAAVAATQGRLDVAATRFAEVANLARRSGERRVMASALMNHGLVLWRSDDRESARSCLRRSLELFRELDDRWGEANACNSLAALLLGQGELEECATLHQRSLTLRLGLEDMAGIAASLEGIGALAEARNAPARALQLISAAGALRQQTGLELTPENLASVERARQRAREGLEGTAADAAQQIGATLAWREAARLAFEPLQGPPEEA